ncbi:hypothetical protein Tco_0978627 [Tanacetum coccineum]|uniref:Uncharacterized protein n=1 Tax=Tanacetum coccineum TaxID=301880 RepID=A0ABQ5ENL6_9ASTR
MLTPAGRPAAESLGGGTGVRVGRGGRGRRPREGNDERVDDFNGQGNDQGLKANGGVEGANGLLDDHCPTIAEPLTRHASSVYAKMSYRSSIAACDTHSNRADIPRMCLTRTEREKDETQNQKGVFDVIIGYGTDVHYRRKTEKREGKRRKRGEDEGEESCEGDKVMEKNQEEICVGLEILS